MQGNTHSNMYWLDTFKADISSIQNAMNAEYPLRNYRYHDFINILLYATHLHKYVLYKYIQHTI
jgi:hypothetical protein